MAFPEKCLLSETQKQTLSIVLSDDDTPCEECSKRPNCPAFMVEEQKRHAVGDPSKCPYHLEDLSTTVTRSDRIAGGFVKCPIDSQEWVFSFDF